MKQDNSIIYDSEEKADERIKVRTGIKWAAVAMLIVVLCFSMTVAVKGYELYREAIDNVGLEDKMASVRTRENYTAFGQLPEIYVDAVLSVEGHRFYNHPGIDVMAIGRIVSNNIKAGSFMKGVSTMIQRLAKNMYFSQEEELVHKAAEVLVVSNLERNYSKGEILELHMNTIYYESGCYCVKDASNGYFGKRPENMADYESTLLAGIPNAPSCYAPTMNQELAVRRQQQVLGRLVKCGYFIEEWALETVAVGSSR